MNEPNDRPEAESQETPSNLDDGLFAAFDGEPTLANPASSASSASDPPRIRLDPVDEPGAELIGRYRVLDAIGSGGIGRVLRARDPDLGREVAIKILRARFADDAFVRTRFVEEAQIGGQLQHPGIVPVYEVGLESGDQPFFAMKLIEGQTLAALLAKRPSPAADRARFLKIFEQVCQTIAYAHTRAVIHRDLKPLNIMVGEFGEVQVVDWGFAKVLSGDDSERSDDSDNSAGGAEAGTASDSSRVSTVRTGDGTAMSMQGSVMGTPAYMPPEQARGQIDQLDRRADVFALGAILCEILTGQAPYVGDRILEQARAGDTESARSRLRSATDEVELLAIACDALQSQPDDRPVDARVLADRVSEYLHSIEARRQAAEIDAREARVHAAAERKARRLWLGLAAVMLVGVIATAFGLIRAEQAKAEAKRSELAMRSIRDFLVDELLGALAPENARGRDLTLREVLARALGDLEDKIPDELIRAMVLSTVGDTLWKTDRHAIAIGKLEAAFSTLSRELGRGHEETRGAAHRLAWVLRDVGRRDEAAVMARETLAIERSTLGPRHPHTLRSRYLLGQLLLDRGQGAAAAEVFRDVWQVRRDELGASHRHTLNALRSYSAALGKEGRFAAARPLLEELVARCKADLEPDDPMTAQATDEMAGGLLDLQEYGKAAAMYRQALAATERAYGKKEVFSYTVTLNNLGVAEDSQGHTDAARVAYEESLRIRTKLRGADHVSVGRVHSNLGRLCERQGDLDQALTHLREALRIASAQPEPNPRQILSCKISLATTIRAAGDATAAEQQLVALLPEAEKLWPAGHFVQARVIHAIAEARADLGRRTEARVGYRRAIKIYGSSIGPSHSRTRRAIAELAELCDADGDAPAAKRWRDRLAALGGDGK